MITVMCDGFMWVIRTFPQITELGSPNIDC